MSGAVGGADLERDARVGASLLELVDDVVGAAPIGPARPRI